MPGGPHDTPPAPDPEGPDGAGDVRRGLHDVANALLAVRLHLETLRKSTPPEGSLRDAVTGMERGLQRSISILRSLLERP